MHRSRKILKKSLERRQRVNKKKTVFSRPYRKGKNMAENVVLDAVSVNTDEDLISNIVNETLSSSLLSLASDSNSESLDFICEESAVGLKNRKLPFEFKTFSPNILREKLCDWAVKNSIPHSYVSELLKILVVYGNHNELPLDARTLLETPRNIQVRKMDNGFYIHLGINNFLKEYVKYKTINSDTIWLSFSTDGTPVSESGASSLWPIFGAIHHNNFRHCFEIGLFHGPTKPTSFNLFLTEFVNELHDLTQHGYKNELNGREFHIKIKCFVADAPALASIKLIKSHAGYFSCTKCETKGYFSSLSKSIVFPETNAHLRTDKSFRNRTSQTENDRHHNSSEHSILEKLPIDMIRDFPLDKMHLVDEGVVKKILILLTSKVNRQKLPPKKIAIINERLETCSSYFPMEFQRKPRSLKYVLKMKATEYRDFLLYTGPVVLKNVVPKRTYNHFLALSIAIRILTSQTLHLEYNDYAQSLLVSFLELFGDIYGTHHISYNVHGVIHLPEDAKRHGPLDSYSCYAFESHIKKIKKMLHSKNMPLQQCFNRLTEKIKFNLSEKYPEIDNESSELEFFKQDVENHAKFFKANFRNFTVDTQKKGNNCILLKNKIVVLAHFFIIESNNIKYVVGQKLTNVKPLSGEKCAKLFFLLIGCFETELTKHVLENKILAKMCCLPYNLNETSYFVSPINHTLLMNSD